MLYLHQEDYFYNSNINLSLLIFYHKNLEILDNILVFLSLVNFPIPKNILADFYFIFNLIELWNNVFF